MSFWGYDEQHEEHEQAMYWHQVEVSHNSMKPPRHTLTLERQVGAYLQSLRDTSPGLDADDLFSAAVAEFNLDPSLSRTWLSRVVGSVLEVTDE